MAEKLFTSQYAKEILALARNEEGQSKLSEYRNTEWVKNLPAVVKNLNETKTRLINAAPDKAITKEKVSAHASLLAKAQQSELDGSVSVRYLLEPGELEQDTKRRATDPVWSIDTFYIGSAFRGGDHWVYYLTDETGKQELNRSFVREELMVVPDNTELPPT